MAAKKQVPAVPPYYEATRDIYLGDPESGAAPVCAYREGDQVHPGVVDAYRLGASVKVPDVFAATDTAAADAVDVLPVEGGKE